MGTEELARPKEPMRSANKKASPPTTMKRTTSDEKDFVDDKELMAAVQYGVLKTSDDILLTINERNGQSDMNFDDEVISRVSALVWDTVVDDWVNDLVALANHASRQSVNMDDIAMLTRRNPQLFQSVREMTNIKMIKPLSTSRGNNGTTKGRKRKSIDVIQPSTSKEEPGEVENSRSNSPILIVTKTPKQAKTTDVETPNPQKSSFLKTPNVQMMTSTPKVGSGSVRAELFVTPIRQTVPEGESTSIQKIKMTRIEEERENGEDSFDANFGTPNVTTSTKQNTSSLIRMAEEDPLPGEKTLKEIEERERAQALLPIEDEYDSFDDDIIVEEIVATTPKTNVKNSSKECTRSPDLFASSNEESTLKSKTNAENKETEKSNSVFSKKLTSFTFEDDEDSFDAPLKQDIVTEPETTMKKQDCIVISDDDDSFDAGPVKDNTPKVNKVNVPIPKWRETQEKWNGSILAKTPSPSSISSEKKKKKLSMDYDSFDEFDFDV